MKSGLPESCSGPLVLMPSIITSILAHCAGPSSNLITVSIPSTFSDKNIYTYYTVRLGAAFDEQAVTNDLKHPRNSPPGIPESPLSLQQLRSTFAPYTMAWLPVGQVLAYLVP